jgi:prophage DNA circulation protein
MTALDKFASNLKRLGTFAASMINAISNTINKIANIVTNIAGALSSIVTGLCTALHGLVNSINTLMNTPCALAGLFKTAADSIKGLAGLGDELQFGGVKGECSGTVRGDTVTLNGETVPESMGISIINTVIDNMDYDETSLAADNYGMNTTEQAENLTLIVNTSKAAMISTLLPIAIRIDFTSQQKMEEMLNKIAKFLDDFLLRLGENSENIDYSDMYTDYDNLKNEFISSMLAKNIGIVKEIDYKVPADVTSSLVLAYDMYYDLDRSWEAQKRNEPLARHPGFLPSGDTIKILEA